MAGSAFGNYSAPQTFAIRGLDSIVENTRKWLDHKTNTLVDAMKESIDLVYNTAREKRPDIGFMEKTTMGVGRVSFRKKKGIRIVSDPNAEYGVPVRTGALRMSIRKNVQGTYGKVTGTVFTDSPYAWFIEYGTQKITPRPFMRPAFDLNKDFIIKIFKEYWSLEDIKTVSSSSQAGTGKSIGNETGRIGTNAQSSAGGPSLSL